MLGYTLNNKLTGGYSEPNLTSQVEQSGDMPSRPEENDSGEDEALMTLEELCKYLKVPKTWIYDRTRRGLIPTIKLEDTFGLSPSKLKMA